ncbi:MAG: AbrB/MazE/SpoVT family DNA-binding domain-containing protein [Thermoleophilaceae bacterium]|nr:AbrB/MazE/SpoVT family DNA-binding domain-containing protein [Thermoleophilaceae bacterium]
MSEPHVHILATLTSKGQVTIPKSVRDALLLETGDKVSFVVSGDEVTLVKEPDFLELAGSVKVPASKRDVPFDQVRKSARAKSAGRRMTS